ncbi:SPJ_0845 family protein [Streptococcus suis]
MAVTYKRQDDLEKMLEEFASFEKLEEIEYPDPKSKVNSDRNNLNQEKK